MGTEWKVDYNFQMLERGKRETTFFHIRHSYSYSWSMFVWNVLVKEWMRRERYNEEGQLIHG